MMNFKLGKTELEVIMGHECIMSEIITEKGSYIILEWLNDNKIERTDSHLKIWEMNNLANIFDVSSKSNLMPIEDYLPLNEIYDALDNEIEKLKL